MLTLTFAPRKGNRYACVQTGDVVTKISIPGYRAAFASGGAVGASKYLATMRQHPRKRTEKKKRSRKRR